MIKPEGFWWGAATSAYQVEGDNIHSDWWQWEKEHRDRVPSGRAADHFTRYREDFALARKLGHNAHRLSLEWSRIELAPGLWNERALNHYRDVLLSLRQENLAAVVTLHHFTNPLWLAKAGGWLAPATPALFARYTRVVAERLGDLVDLWITINEPMIYAGQCYWHGRWPPQHSSGVEYWRVINNLAAAHERAYNVLHHVTPTTPVGIAKHLIDFVPGSASVIDRSVAAAHRWWFNHRFFSLTPGTHDFIGVNYYSRLHQRVAWWPPRLVPVPWSGATSDIGWAIYPEGLYRVLLELKKYRVPLYVTENGLADAADKHRAEYIRGHLRAIERSQAHGADVRGYFHWSLLDNFEWASGFTPRFGLVAVDYETQARQPRPSAQVFRAIIEQAKR